MTARQARDLPPYEGMDRSRPFYEMTMEEQRDELLALAGVLVPYLSEHLPPWPLAADGRPRARGRS